MAIGIVSDVLFDQEVVRRVDNKGALEAIVDCVPLRIAALLRVP